MKYIILAALFATSMVSAEVVFSPAEKASPNIEQIRVTFPEQMEKVETPFTVQCDPEISGHGNWADNNTTWVFNLDVKKNNWGDPLPLPGGASCEVKQQKVLMTSKGTQLLDTNLTHSFTVEGPHVTEIMVLPGMNGRLRETQPVFMVLFDGDIDRNTVADTRGNFLWYPAKDGNPNEKITFSAVPENKVKDLFKAFNEEYYFGYRQVELESKNWAMLTINRNLVPGSDVNLLFSAVESAYSSKAKIVSHNKGMKVRDNFKAEANCSRVKAGSFYCMPEGSVSVRFNAPVSWGIAKEAYLEYVPQNSEDGSKVRVAPSSENVASSWLGYVAEELGVSANDKARVENLVFNVKVAPETVAKLVLPSGLSDVDARVLKSTEFELPFGSFSEIIDFPKNLTIMERKLKGNNSLPVSVMNLNQKIKVVKSGSSLSNWAPVTDMKKIIDLVVGYDVARSRFRFNDEKAYVSPLLSQGIAYTEEEVALTGTTNEQTFLSVEFEPGKKSGLYAVEIQSELSQRKVPEYNLTLLTDLNIHVKMGKKYSTAWVTSFSTGLPVAGADLKIYNCFKEVSVSGRSDINGMFKFSNQNAVADCSNIDSNSNLLSSKSFFVTATTQEDMAFTHSSYTADESYATSAPGVEFFYSGVEDNKVYIHSLVGVNLVKPGQTVPVQLTAIIPQQKGFSSVDADTLPKSVEISSYDSDVSYKFPLNWVNGVAEFKWEVPQSAELGSYSVQIQKPGRRWSENVGTDIEVSEFKVPLMKGNINLGKKSLVNPEKITATGFIQFANGVGARDQDVEISYYFSPTSISSKDYNGFDFVAGEFGDDTEVSKTKLPTSEQIALIEGLKTDSEGSLSIDFAKESLTSGETIRDLLSQETKPYKIIARMKYQDQMGEFQTVSSSQSIYNASSYVGTKVSKGKLVDASLNVVSLGVDGKAYTNLSDLKVEVLKVVTHVMGEEVFGGFIKNTFENELVETKWSPECQMDKGVANCSARGLEKGQYILVAESKTNGQKTFSKFKVDADGILTGERDYYYDDEDENNGILLATDKKDYKGGDIAKLSFETPFENCSALVTLERAEIVESYVDTEACSNGFVEVKVSAENAPNIFASVYLVAGRADSEVSFDSFDLGKPAYRMGYSNLKVDWENYALSVEVNLDKEEYKPGDVATANVDVKAMLGEVSDASVTFFAIEEKILELKSNDSMKLLDSLMGMRRHGVRTAHGYDFLNSVAEVEAVLAESAAARSGGVKAGEEGGSGSELEAFQRKLFDSLVVWESNVPVVNGHAQISFKLNDKLTKFKVFAVVKDGTSKFGTGESSYLASQEVQTFSNIPSVARTGDKFPAMATVQNNGKQNGTYAVVLDYVVTLADGTKEPKSLREKILVEKGASKSVKIGDILIGDEAEVVDYAITVYNENGMIVDALKPEPQIVSPAVPLTVQDEFFAQMEKDVIDFKLKKDLKALPKKGVIDTKVFSSLVDTTEYSIKKSISEDVFVDLTVEGQLIKALMSSDASDMTEMIKAYSELLSQVDTKGFIKYYASAPRGNFWLTAEMVQILGMKPWALDIMPDSLKDKLFDSFLAVVEGKIDAKYIASESNKIAWVAASVKAINALIGMDANYIGFGSGVLEKVKSSAEYKDYSLDLLSDIALLTSSVEPAQLMSSALMKYIQEAKLSVKDTSAILKGNASYGWWGYSDEIVSTSKMIKAQSKAAQSTGAASSENFLDNLVVGVVQANKQNKWYTNRTKAWVLNGLVGFARTYEAQPVDGVTLISSSESSVSSKVLWSASDESNGVATVWKNEEAVVKVSHDGAGKPWVSVIAQSAVKITEPNYQGIKIVKKMTNKTRSTGEMKAGDLIQVDITVENPSSLSHVALFDPIPSGANILSDGWGGFSSAQKSYSGYKVYFNFLRGGATQLSYQYQLNNPGDFQLPQTRVEALYEPGLFGEVPNGSMKVVK